MSQPKKSAAPKLTSAPDGTDPGTVSQATITRRRCVFAPLVLLFTVLALVALVSYDWRDIRWMCNPPNTPAVNSIGHVGAWMTFLGYGLGGLAYRYMLTPLMAVLFLFLMHGHVRFFRLRLVWMAILYIGAAGLFQIYGSDAAVLQAINLRPNGGGAIGQWMVTDFLLPLIGPVGTQLLLWIVTALMAVLLIGVRNFLLALIRVTSERPKRLESDPARVPLPRAETIRPATAPLPPTVEDEDDEEDDGDEAPDARRGLLSRIFSRRREAEAEAEKELDIRDLLIGRPPAGASEPPVRAQTPAPTPASVRPAAVPRPEAPDLVLSADNPSKLRPVASAKSITQPVPAAHEQDDPSEPADAQALPDYGLPTTALLDPIPPKAGGADDVQGAIDAIESVFRQFNIAAHVVNHISGPVLTQFEVRPEPGVKVERFLSYENNLLMALRAESIRIQAPIPGRDVVGIEVPNTIRQSVTLREVLEGNAWKKAERTMALPLALGKISTGGDLIVDLAEMPHLLVAGGTGSGKSVAVNDMLIGLLMCRKPERLRLLMVDPKRVEFTFYDNLPHLLNPVVVEPKKVLFCLRWAVVEMDRRYKLLQQYGVRNIADYNRRAATPLPGRSNPTAPLPYIVIVIDELAELILTVKADIEPSITSLTQKARAAGIHMIIATQRPTTDIVTGTIKANIPGRIALRVAQANDSRTILDETGAENLIGKGDMLLARSGKSLVRSQAAWVSDEEIVRVCDFIKEQAGPAFDTVLSSKVDQIREDPAADTLEATFQKLATPATASAASATDAPAGGEGDDDKSDEGYYRRALELIRQTGRFSTSAMQRRLGIGYNKAGRITDMLEDRGIIGPQNGNAPREILVDLNAVDREALAGTDGEDAAPDTRTSAENAAPDAAPTPDAATEGTDEAFEIDFDPSLLEESAADDGGAARSEDGHFDTLRP